MDAEQARKKFNEEMGKIRQAELMGKKKSPEEVERDRAAARAADDQAMSVKRAAAMEAGKRAKAARDAASR